MPFASYDYLLVGGGLQNSLIALALLGRGTGARVAMVEQGARVGGNHLWCFHHSDLSPAGHELVRPLRVKDWDGYSVRFPNFERRLESTYSAVTSERLAEHVENVFEAAGSQLLIGCAAARVSATSVTLADGRELSARVVVDARGPETHSGVHVIAFQKFLGLELELGHPSPLLEPVVMDATVAQHDGFRFVYCLPLSPTRVLLEDTYFADGPELDRPLLRERVLAYASGLGLDVIGVAREEIGVLPLPGAPLPSAPAASPLHAGYAGGWFHPTTGYSFPIATRLALHVAASTPETVFGPAFSDLAAEHARQQRFACLLNRLLFQAAPKDARRNVLERFYKLPAPTVARFYALSTTAFDRARIICGRPPRGMNVGRALTKGLLQ